MVTASLYLRKVPSNHILLESSLVLEYFCIKIVAMVIVFPTVSDDFYVQKHQMAVQSSTIIIIHLYTFSVRTPTLLRVD